MFTRKHLFISKFKEGQVVSFYFLYQIIIVSDTSDIYIRHTMPRSPKLKRAFIIGLIPMLLTASARVLYSCTNGDIIAE